jgi:RNA polymerase sigma factor FliA
MSEVTASRPSAARARSLLRRYRDEGDVDARNQLVLLYAPMVRHITYKKIRELPPHCDAEDFLTAGMEALIKAADRYDPERGTSFEQYAWTRVLGAIVDEMRRDDFAPRSVRRFARAADRTADRLASRDGRPPTDQELASVLGVTVDELRTKRHEVHGADVISLDSTVRTEGRASLGDLLPDDSGSHDPQRAAFRSEAKARFRKAFAALPERDREVALKVYVANMTLREVGEQLGVTESRVCQIHTQLRKRLKAELAADAELFDAMA